MGQASPSQPFSLPLLCSLLLLLLLLLSLSHPSQARDEDFNFVSEPDTRLGYIMAAEGPLVSIASIGLLTGNGSMTIKDCSTIPCIEMGVFSNTTLIGYSMDFNGHRLLAAGERSLFPVNTSVFIFDCNVSPCVLKDQIIGPSEDFGASVQMEGDILVVGGCSNQGPCDVIHFYNCSSFPCTKISEISKPSDITKWAYSVAFSPPYLAVGSNAEGVIEVYDCSILPCHRIFNTSSPNVGNFLSFSKGRLAIPRYQSTVLLVDCALGSCVIVGNVSTPNVGASDNFGYSVSLRDNLLLVGAPMSSADSSGLAYLFDCYSLPCTHIETLNPAQPSSGISLGDNVALGDFAVVCSRIAYSPPQQARTYLWNAQKIFCDCPDVNTVDYRCNATRYCNCAAGFLGQTCTEVAQCPEYSLGGSTWVSVPWGSNSSATCPSGFGVYDPDLQTFVPFGTGIKVCVLSPNGTLFWQDSPACDEITISCGDLDCTHGGSCTPGANPQYDDASCNCTLTGYGGEFCDVYIDHCLSSPCQHGGGCINDLGASPSFFTCNCSGTGFEGETCQTNIDDCLADSCQNEGLCVDGINSVTCNCTGTGFEGETCEINIDDCTVGYCQHMGQCIDGINSASCNCTGTGFEGELCQTNIDDCLADSCQNEGQCVDGINSVTCNCTGTGFEGETCETNVDDCTTASCQNEGQCVDGINGVTCNCTGTGFEGELCQTNIDDCLTDSCQHGGQCVDEINSVTCTCVGTGYQGETCGEPIDGDCRPSGASCLNGGLCLENATDAFICSCPSAYKGPRCETPKDCRDLPCQNGGECSTNSHQCLCQGEFNGIFCEQETIVCDDNSCANGGTCDDTGVNQIKCTCSSWRYIGSTCSTDAALILGLVVGIGGGLLLLAAIAAIYFCSKGNLNKATSKSKEKLHEGLSLSVLD